MAKKIKFPLVLRDDQRAHTIEELREYFDPERMYGYFRDGKLLTWLEDRYYDDEARQIRELNPDEDGMMKKLCSVLSVEFPAADLYEQCMMRQHTDEEFKRFLEASYEDVLAGALHHEDPASVRFLLSPRFLSCLVQVVEGREVPPGTRVRINKLGYGYLTGHFGQRNEETSDLVWKLSGVVNAADIAQLTGLGIGRELAGYMALSGRSAESGHTNIRRVNFIICTSLSRMYDFASPDKLPEQKEAAEQMVMKIYSKLFPEMLPLLEGVMLDVHAPDEGWMTEPASRMYGITTSAVLNMLNRLPKETIREVLASYAKDYASMYGPEGYGPRVRLKGLSGDYAGILTVAKELESENVYVP